LGVGAAVVDGGLDVVVFLLIVAEGFSVVVFKDTDVLAPEISEMDSTDVDSLVVLVYMELAVSEDIGSCLLPPQDTSKSDSTHATTRLNHFFITLPLSVNMA
jgi:hypothetical protein